MAEEFKLSDRFFIDNPLSGPDCSAARLLAEMSKLDSRMRQPHFLLSLSVDAEHRKAINDELQMIRTAYGNDLLSLMETMTDTTCRPQLCKRILSFGDTMMPDLIRNWGQNRTIPFCECAALVVSHADTMTLPLLEDEMGNFRSHLALSTACLVFAYRDYRPALPKVLHVFKKLRSSHAVDGDSLEQGPLIALYILTGNGSIKSVTRG